MCSNKGMCSTTVVFTYSLLASLSFVSVEPQLLQWVGLNQSSDSQNVFFLFASSFPFYIIIWEFFFSMFA